jgi:hypothetical protein
LKGGYLACLLQLALQQAGTGIVATDNKAPLMSSDCLKIVSTEKALTSACVPTYSSLKISVCERRAAAKSK